MRDAHEKTAKELFSGNEPTTTTRDRLIDHAINLFYAHGFHAVGIDQIIRDVGVTKTTFYNHFESKDDLIVEAIARRDIWESSFFTRRVQELGGDDPRGQLLAIFDVLDEVFNHPDYNGCIFVNACAAFPAQHDPIHEVAAAHYTGAEQLIRQIARSAGVKDPDELAHRFTILIEGAVTHRQVTGRHDAGRRAKLIAAQLLDLAIGNVDDVEA